jgi:hypothetical protein
MSVVGLTPCSQTQTAPALADLHRSLRCVRAVFTAYLVMVVSGLALYISIGLAHH